MYGRVFGPTGIRLGVRGYQAGGVHEDQDARRPEQEGNPQLGAAFEP